MPPEPADPPPPVENSKNSPKKTLLFPTKSLRVASDFRIALAEESESPRNPNQNGSYGKSNRAFCQAEFRKEGDTRIAAQVLGLPCGSASTRLTRRAGTVNVGH